MMRDPPAALNTRHQQRKKLHGPILGAVSEQVWVHQEDGTQALYAEWIWKEWFKRAYGIKGSTEDLSDDAFAEFVWATEIFAVRVMGVVFTEKEPQ